MSKLLSIVVPCYNEDAVLPLYYETMETIELPIDREYIFINDGSSDGTLAILKQLAAKDNRVRVVSFSRNFGKESGILAGLKEAKGDFVVMMDVDLQDPPDLLPEMYSRLTIEPIDCVGTRRVDRKGEPVVRSLFAKGFYWLINKISETEILDGVRDYRMMTRQMVDSVLEVSEYNRFSKGIFSWVGYRTVYLPYVNTGRAKGETTWSFWGLTAYAIDGIISYSTAPLLIASLIGIVLFIISMVAALWLTIRTMLFDNPVEGWTSLSVIMLGLGGIQLLSLGVLGQYVGKTFLESKKRPHYIIQERHTNES